MKTLLSVLVMVVTMGLAAIANDIRHFRGDGDDDVVDVEAEVQEHYRGGKGVDPDSVDGFDPNLEAPWIIKEEDKLRALEGDDARGMAPDDDDAADDDSDVTEQAITEVGDEEVPVPTEAEETSNGGLNDDFMAGDDEKIRKEELRKTPSCDKEGSDERWDDDYEDDKIVPEKNARKEE